MLAQMESQIGIGNRMLDEMGWTGRRVLGYKLPEWQRQEVWTDGQCIRFIESIWLGVGLGAFMVNMRQGAPIADMVLLDGQQRLRSIERYWADHISVSGEDRKEHYWSEFTPLERAHFYRIPFPWIQTQYETDQELRDAYDRHNFGGTPNTCDLGI